VRDALGRRCDLVAACFEDGECGLTVAVLGFADGAAVDEEDVAALVDPRAADPL
jgi:hypothetical protein